MTEISRVSRPDSWRQEFIRRNRGRCHYCNRPGTPLSGPDDRSWHVDHKQALARGGADEEYNLVLACKRCNLAKGVQPYDQFAAFARAAFWVPDDWRVSEYDLDSLASRYQDIADTNPLCAEDLTWRVDTERGRIVMTGCEDWSGNFTESVVELGPVLMDHLNSEIKAYPMLAENVLWLIADMHRTLPAMIAEIRMLRAETAAKTTNDEAAA